ncbi:MAG: sodium-translocating pyrophosphatase [Chitinivibrionales bacterium]|nr:sodium-translocating pyrophosphatase [Chitinivibrionales bacterium]
MKKKPFILSAAAIVIGAAIACPVFGSEASLVTPDLSKNPFYYNLMLGGIGVCVLSLFFGLYEFLKIKNIKAHSSMLEIGSLIYSTCRTYLIQQGKFLAVLEILIGCCIAFYFGVLQHMNVVDIGIILLWSVIGILGSYSVAWFGIRINTYANARTAFAALSKKPYFIQQIPISSGMSIGVFLVSVELIMMLSILLFIPSHLTGACFIGFAIGESLGASALRICGGIFTKIADIGSDLMKIVFKIKEDDPRNPGVIADCTGDNAGDSVGPTADGFETYGVTGVALISFIVLAIQQQYQATIITWIFAMRILMIITSITSYKINDILSKLLYRNKDKINFEQPLTNLVWITSIISIFVTFGASYWLLADLPNNLWIMLSLIISCGTLGAALIPELTKIFTSTTSKHCREVVTASKEGGTSLTILSGLVAGNMSAFWIGMAFVGLMFTAYQVSLMGLADFMIYPSIFAFGLVAFGFLGMGPVTIAVDSYGPVTDNAQSVYELSMIENIPDIKNEIKKDFGYTPDFEKAKLYLEENDGAGNTFKATAKPVLIGTAVTGATTMIFSLILLLKQTLNIEPEMVLNLLNPYTLLGFIAGGCVIYWFTGASIQAVTAGSYRAVEYIKNNIKLEGDIDKVKIRKNSIDVVKICTQYAQKGMVNIFIVIFSLSLAFAFFSAPSKSADSTDFFVAYLISIAVFGLFQAIFMANAGGCWDNAKKLVEVTLNQKGTDLHASTVVGDTVGDPFKDTSSVALNPIIKFTTLFGLLAMEISISESFRSIAPYVGVFFFAVALVYVWRSFYGMRVPAVNFNWKK